MTLPIFRPDELAPGETLEPQLVNGRFRIKCPDGKQRLYSRVTTVIKAIDDRSRLEAWKNRVVVTGLFVASDLMREAIDLLDRDAMDKLVERAFEAGDGYLKSRRGTRLHRLAELMDTKQLLPNDLSPDEGAGLAEYLRMCRDHGIVHLLRERRVVIDHRQVTGTPDSVCSYTCLDGVRRNVILDLKTADKDGLLFGRGEMAQQLSLYAEGVLYTDDGSDTGLREPLPDVSRDVGLILHVPQTGLLDGTRRPRLYEVDLRMGLHLAGLSASVRAARNYGKRVFTEVPA